MKRSESEVLTRKEIAALLEAAVAVQKAARTPMSVKRARRDRLMIEVGLYCGASVSETCKLRREDIGNGTIAFKSLGGRRNRKVELRPSLAAELKEWRQEPGYLFRVTERTFQRRLVALARMAGIEKPVYPHLLRHTFAELFLAPSLTTSMRAQQLGIRNLDRVYAHAAKNQE